MRDDLFELPENPRSPAQEANTFARSLQENTANLAIFHIKIKIKKGHNS